MRGRKPTPTRLKLLRATGHPERLNPREPTPHPLVTTLPAELAGDAVASAEWRRVVVPASAAGILTSADRCLAIAHCALWSVWLEQLADASKRPHVIAAGKHGYPMPNPARTMANRTLLLLSQVDEKLGFSPTSRSRVAAVPPAPPRPTFDRQRAWFLETDRG